MISVRALILYKIGFQGLCEQIIDDANYVLHVHLG
jgi:hypothetical protein